MFIQNEKGILYPENNCVIPFNGYVDKKLPCFEIVPHKSWKFAKNSLDTVFSSLFGLKPEYVFVFAPLHKGKIDYSDNECIYTYTDCPVEHSFLVRDDDICSEEFSFEILQNHINAYFPDSISTCFYATSKTQENKIFIEYLKKTYPNSVFLISWNGENCPKVWQ